jgi:hypothetical protein
MHSLRTGPRLSLRATIRNYNDTYVLAKLDGSNAFEINEFTAQLLFHMDGTHSTEELISAAIANNAAEAATVSNTVRTLLELLQQHGFLDSDGRGDPQ